MFIGQGLLEILIRRSLSDNNSELAIDEVRLIARAFAAFPPEVLINEHIPIFDRASVMHYE